AAPRSTPRLVHGGGPSPCVRRKPPLRPRYKAPTRIGAILVFAGLIFRNLSPKDLSSQRPRRTAPARIVRQALPRAPSQSKSRMKLPVALGPQLQPLVAPQLMHL